MSEKIEKIVVLIVLLFILSYLIFWNYDKLIRESEEIAEKERDKQALKYLESEQHDPYITWNGEKINTTTTAISKEELETLTSISNEIYMDCTVTAGIIEQEETIAYYIMPKSLDLLIKDFISFKQDKEEIYKLIWKWMGYDYVEDVNTVIISPLHPLYQEDFVAMRSAKDFIEWLYENDYKIVKEEGK